MAQDTIRAGFLNIVATPHPKGVYVRNLKAAAEKSVKFWGPLRAAITEPTSIPKSKSLYSFQLVVWTEINPDEPTISKSDFKKGSFPREGKEFTNQYGVNGRVFYCIFDNTNHTLTTELTNEDGKDISPSRLRKIFSNLLSPEILGLDAEDFEITVIPTEDAISYVLGLNRLDKVDILVKRPNEDDITKDVNRVMSNLMDQNAKSEQRTLRRQAKTDGIELSDENETYAQVAAENGHVDSSGLDGEGQHDKRSTKEVPKIVRRAIAKGTSYFAALQRIAREARDNSDKP